MTDKSVDIMGTNIQTLLNLTKIHQPESSSIEDIKKNDSGVHLNQPEIPYSRPYS